MSFVRRFARVRASNEGTNEPRTKQRRRRCVLCVQRASLTKSIRDLFSHTLSRVRTYISGRAVAAEENAPRGSCGRTSSGVTEKAFEKHSKCDRPMEIVVSTRSHTEPPHDAANHAKSCQQITLQLCYNCATTVPQLRYNYATTVLLLRHNYASQLRYCCVQLPFTPADEWPVCRTQTNL